MKRNLATIRKDYSLRQLTRDSVNKNPVFQLETWLSEALEAQVNEPTAMTLATAETDGRPSARVVLLKDVNEKGLTFYTNYESPKGRQLNKNPQVAVVFFWPELERQVRFAGVTERLPSGESDKYFNSRPEGSQIGAWASRQSSVLGSRQELEREVEKTIQRFKKTSIHRPDYWGGYLILPDSAEFWQGRPDRLHDRISYRLQGGSWIINRLAP